MNGPDRTPCQCGHGKYDHLGAGRCDNGSKRCGCQLFRECFHPETERWRHRRVCVVCGQVQDNPAAAETAGAA